MRLFARKPMIVEAVQWTGHNEAEVKELAGDKFQSVLRCEDDAESCKTCGEHMDITAELTISPNPESDDDEYTQGMETGWWVIKVPDGRLTCMADSILQFNYQEVVP